jgi:hypothetical protein
MVPYSQPRIQSTPSEIGLHTVSYTAAKARRVGSPQGALKHMTGERSESEGFYEMLWNCDHCSAQGLLAKSQRHCPECGAPQNPDKRYYPAPGQQQRVDGHQYVGADRTCPACRAPMSANGKNCTQCGSPLDGSKEVMGVDDRVAPAAPVAKPRRKHRWWPYVALAIVLGGFAIWWFLIRKHEQTVQVASHRWECAIPIQEFQLRHAAAWRDQLPIGANALACFSKERTTQKIADGEDCHMERHDKKDGTFEQVKKCTPKYRSEPVNDQWCDYTITNWAQVDQIKQNGTGTTITCPTQGPPADVPPQLGARRSAPKIETRTLDFGGGGTCDVAADVWTKYSDGQKIKLEVRSRSDEVVCDSL